MKKILLVDDQKTVLHVLNFALASSRIEIVLEINGQEALRQARAQQFDLILLDMHLPDISGLEVLRQLKLDETTQEIPVIFLTGSNQLEDKVQALSLGAIDYLSKPFTLDEIQHCVNRVLFASRS